MKYLLLTSLCLYLGHLYGQNAGYDSLALKHGPYIDPNYENNRWTEGYLINKRGDTVFGKVKTGGDFYDISDRPWQVEFKSVKGIETQYDPTQLKEYGYNEGNHYKVFVSLQNTFANVGGTFHNEPKIFLEQVSPGRYSVFVYSQNLNRTTKSKNTGIQHYCISREGKDLLAIKSLKFKKTMMSYFSDCPSIMARIKQRIYKYQNWKDMIRECNALCK